jgi:hypothetical protein
MGPPHISMARSCLPGLVAPGLGARPSGNLGESVVEAIASPRSVDWLVDPPPSGTRSEPALPSRWVQAVLPSSRCRIGSATGRGRGSEALANAGVSQPVPGTFRLRPPGSDRSAGLAGGDRGAESGRDTRVAPSADVEWWACARHAIIGRGYGAFAQFDGEIFRKSEPKDRYSCHSNP